MFFVTAVDSGHISNLQAIKLSPLQANWPMEPALVSGFCNFKQARVWFPLDGTLIHHRVAPSRYWYSFTYPRWMENWVSLGEKKVDRGIELETLILLTVPTMLIRECIAESISYYMKKGRKKVIVHKPHCYTKQWPRTDSLDQCVSVWCC